jgi:glycosyltransferase involved in cell wall biosynthesis
VPDDLQRRWGADVSDVERNAPELSVVVPLYNEEANVLPLYAAVRSALGEEAAWELLLVDDGSSDGTVDRAREVSRADGRVTLVRLSRNFGQTAAMQAGFDHAVGRVVVSMDGDLQNDPRDIPKVVSVLEEGYDVVAGYRVHRQDHVLTRKVPSWVANRIIRWITGVSIRDNGCSLKAFRREVFDRVRLYSDMHRFIPAVAAGTAGARITEVPVRHHARQHGRSKYGASRIGKVLADILTIKMIRSFKDQPLRLFGLGALWSAGIGAVFLVAAIAAMLGLRPEAPRALVLPAASVLWWGVSLYLLMLGLIAETLVRRWRWRGRASLPLSRERSASGMLDPGAVR